VTTVPQAAEVEGKLAVRAPDTTLRLHRTHAAVEILSARGIITPVVPGRFQLLIPGSDATYQRVLRCHILPGSKLFIGRLIKWDEKDLAEIKEEVTE
jgi:hypothetical protein